MIKHVKKTTYKQRRDRIRKNLSSYKTIDPITGKVKQKESKPEIRVKYILRSLGVLFEQEYKIRYLKSFKSYDFYCFKQGEYKLLVEIDGQYWHAYDYQEGHVPLSKLSKLQRRNIRNDRKKDILAKKSGIKLLRFWEKDIKTRVGWVKKQIVNEIEQQRNQNIIK